MVSQMTEPEIQFALARVEQCLGEERPMDAIPDLQAVLAAVPNHPGALCGIGRVSIQLGDNNAALQALDLALGQVPEMLEARNARGVAYQNLNRLAEAEADFRFVCGRLPDNPGALLNMGGLLAAKGDFTAAEQYFERILSVSPDNPTAGYNLGLLHLVTGRLAEGWRGFDLRGRADNVGLAPGRSPQPGWSGENLPQGTLLIQAEQGLGDNIQFIRYAALARARVGRVVVEAPAPLMDLFSGIAGVDDVVAREHPLPPHDVQIAVMSLPRVFETEIDTVPWDGAYIRPAPERVAYWRNRLGTGGRVRHVGLVWAGNPGHKRDRQRSVALSALAPLFDVEGAVFHSLQIGPAAAQMDAVPFGHRIRPVFRKARPFKEVAAIVSALDLVIGVDTSLVHLAGAMARPVWTMVTRVPDWRWMLDRADTPWYPTMCLFRQPEPGAWDAVATDIVSALRAFTDAKA
jgi:cytochrome c-type biogenesis protein CcmH/NrfG